MQQKQPPLSPKSQTLLICMNTIITAVDIAGSMLITSIERTFPYRGLTVEYVTLMLQALYDAGLINIKDAEITLTPAGRVRANQIAKLLKGATL